MNWTHRRFLFAALVVATTGLLSAWLALVLAAGGFGVVAAIMVVAFAFKASWAVMNFWSAAIGFARLRHGAGALEGAPAPPNAAIEHRVAIAMTVRDEDVVRLVARLRSVKASLDASGYGDRFDYYLLSDSRRPDVVAAEELAVADWRAEFPDADRIVYRRRERNSGAQHGNLYDFCRRFGAGYEVMIALDADSLMTAGAILELVRIMQAHPRVGMLQSVNTGILPPSLFARIFEFGHRHGMRCWIAGAAWWQGERGQYRGHNAAIRVAAYAEHCNLAELPGEEPYGGVMFCHDQIESALMHRAGYEIRELSLERGSFEGVPPALADFTTRCCRWFQGNLKNLRMLRLPGLTAMDRYHLVGVAHRFMTWPAVVLFVALAMLRTLKSPASQPFPAGSALALYASCLAIYFAPKFLGLVDSALGAPRSYGGVARLAAGGLVDLALTLLLLPTAMLTATVFVAGLLAGRTLTWDTQRRAGYRLSWAAAARNLWPHTALGAGSLAAIGVAAPEAIPWFLPFLAGLALAIPFAVATTSVRLNRLASRWRICALPEEIDVPNEIASALAFEAADGASRPEKSFRERMRAHQAPQRLFAVRVLGFARVTGAVRDRLFQAIAIDRQGQGVGDAGDDRAGVAAEILVFAEDRPNSGEGEQAAEIGVVAHELVEHRQEAFDAAEFRGVARGMGDPVGEIEPAGFAGPAPRSELAHDVGAKEMRHDRIVEQRAPLGVAQRVLELPILQLDREHAAGRAPAAKLVDVFRQRAFLERVRRQSPARGDGGGAGRVEIFVRDADAGRGQEPREFITAGARRGAEDQRPSGGLAARLVEQRTEQRGDVGPRPGIVEAAGVEGRDGIEIVQSRPRVGAPDILLARSRIRNRGEIGLDPRLQGVKIARMKDRRIFGNDVLRASEVRPPLVGMAQLHLGHPRPIEKFRRLGGEVGPGHLGDERQEFVGEQTRRRGEILGGVEVVAGPLREESVDGVEIGLRADAADLPLHLVGSFVDDLGVVRDRGGQIVVRLLQKRVVVIGQSPPELRLGADVIGPAQRILAEQILRIAGDDALEQLLRDRETVDRRCVIPLVAIDEANIAVDHREMIGPENVVPKLVVEPREFVARLGEPIERVVVIALAKGDVAALVLSPGDAVLRGRAAVALRHRQDPLVVTIVVGGERLVGVVEFGQQDVAEILILVGELLEPAHRIGVARVELQQIPDFRDRRLIVRQRAVLVVLVVGDQAQQMPALGAKKTELGVAAGREFVQKVVSLLRLVAHALDIAALPIGPRQQQQRPRALLGDAGIARERGEAVHGVARLHDQRLDGVETGDRPNDLGRRLDQRRKRFDRRVGVVLGLAPTIRGGGGEDHRDHQRDAGDHCDPGSGGRELLGVGEPARLFFLALLSPLLRLGARRLLLGPAERRDRRDRSHRAAPRCRSAHRAPAHRPSADPDGRATPRRGRWRPSRARRASRLRASRGARNPRRAIPPAGPIGAAAPRAPARSFRRSLCRPRPSRARCRSRAAAPRPCRSISGTDSAGMSLRRAILRRGLSVSGSMPASQGIKPRRNSASRAATVARNAGIVVGALEGALDRGVDRAPEAAERLVIREPEQRRRGHIRDKAARA